jgi:N-acetylneuraminate synthase/N,N'-diacetyllegionaminate synthase
LNLRAIQSLRERFGKPVGFSDHSEGMLGALVAAALGAKVLEKHFTLDRNGIGPDHKLSMEPGELRELVRQLAIVEASLGNGWKHPAKEEEQSRLASRRSVVTAVDIPMHETIQPWMVTCKRPGGGIDPREIDLVTGSQARRHLAKDSILGWSDLLMPDRHEAGSTQRTQSATACNLR